MPQSSIAQQELSKVYDRINSVESKVDETNGYLRGVLEFNGKITVQNDKLIRQNARNTYLFFLLGLFGWLVVAYGAVGRDWRKRAVLVGQDLRGADARIRRNPRPQEDRGLPLRPRVGQAVRQRGHGRVRLRQDLKYPIPAE